MGDVSRTITIKFTAQSKNLVTEVAKVDAALSTVGKQNTEIKRLSESMQTLTTTSTQVSKTTSKLTAFKDAVSSFAQGVQPLGSVGLGLAAVTAGVITLAKAGPFLAPLLGLMGLLPGAALVAAGAFGVLKLGSDGIAAAFKGVGDTAKKQVSDVFQKQLAPAAKSFNELLNILTPNLKGIAVEMSAVGVSFARTASNAGNVKSLNTILIATKMAVGNIGFALNPLISVLLTIASVAAPVFASLTDNASTWALKLQARVQEIAQNGKLGAWIQGGIDKFVALKNGVVRVWNDIKPILEALAKQRFTLFAGASSLIEPALKAIGNFMSTHPDFAQWLVVGGLALKGFAVAMTLVNAAMDINPIILAIGAIALLATGLAALYNNNAGFKAWVDAVWAGIQSATEAFITWWQQNVSPLLAAGWELVKAAAQGAYEFFRDTLIPGLKKLWADIAPVLQQAWKNLVDAWNELKPTLMELYQWIKDHWSEIKQAAKDYGEAIGIVFGVVAFILGLMVASFAGWAAFITGYIKDCIELFNLLKDAAQTAAKWIGQHFLDLANTLNDVGLRIARVLATPWDDVKAASGVVSDWIQTTWSSLPGFFGRLGIQIASGILGGLNGIVSGARWVINQLIDVANTGINAVNGVTGAVGIPKIPNIPHLAKGGPVQAGRPYIVGDGGGPELFVPRQSGRVVGTQDTADLMSSDGGGFQGDLYLTFDLGEGITQRIQISNRQLRAAVRAGR